MVTSVAHASSDDDVYFGTDMALNEMSEMELHDLTMTDMFKMVDKQLILLTHILENCMSVSPLRLSTIDLDQFTYCRPRLWGA